MNTNHYQIFDFWKYKYINGNGQVLEKHKDVDDVLIVTDWGEPDCWACGKPISLPESDDKFLRKNNNFKGIWEHPNTKHGLERCHILPKALGGIDDPSNLFLMCEDCHRLSPDTTNNASFFRWVYNRRKHYFLGGVDIHHLQHGIEQELKMRGYNLTIDKFFDIVGCAFNQNSKELSESLQTYFDNNATSHWSKFSESTMYAIIVDWMLHTYLCYCLPTV